MCLGIPMQVHEADAMTARCVGRNGEQRVSLALTGPVTVGDFVLVHLGTAIRVITADEARLVDDALCCLEAANRGDDISAFFADLTSREPELPPHLRSPQPPQSQQASPVPLSPAGDPTRIA